MGDDAEGGRQLVRTVRSICAARWVGVAFAVLQVSTYETLPYPPGVQAVGYALAALLALGNLTIWLLARDTDGGQRAGRVRTPTALAAAGLVVDVVVIVGVLWLYAFDTESSLFILLFVLPAEAAATFRLRGALLTWAGTTALYVGRELSAVARYGAEFSIISINFRMGVLLLLSVILGMFARDAARRRDELRDALESLEAEAAWRDGLISMLAHDLRSPIGGAASTMHLLEHRLPDIPPERAAELAGGAARQNRRVLRLADDLLDVARARNGRLEIRRERVDVGETVAELVAEADATDDVRVEVPADLQAEVDRKRFGQIVTNLVTNARKHGRPPVTISAEALPHGGVVLRVADSGDGVPAAQQEQLFLAFARGPRADSVGLGLWVTHTLAAAHGGSVAYEPVDEAPCFVVRLPGEAD